MPHLKVNSPTGDVNFFYNITTPASPSSPAIDPNLPSVLFIHGEYVPQQIFEAQFSDPELRNRFNLIGIDLRGYGATGGFTPKTYTPTHAAHDLYLFLEALQISKIHIFALSINTHIALVLAATHPDLVHSLMLCSTVPPQEPEGVAAGRVELFEFWSDSQVQESGGRGLKGFDEDLLATLLKGAQQMLFSDNATPLAEAVTLVSLEYNAIGWAGTPEARETGHTFCLDWFLERRVFDVDFFSKIGCPVAIIHCEDDIAYPFGHAEELQAQLTQAGNARVTLCQIPGPRYANVLYPEILNPIIRNHILSVTEPNNPPGKGVSVVKKESLLETPFKEILAKYGYRADSSDEDSE
ncbi:putative regulation of endocannabinoid signaling pathway [Lyophyllum shimeji]|uniref:Regulation of endocannabinoid signaling pathway n=1 Tax=Lyophyllum shimeji TaxID=47721 RepID=A0A9P3PNF5_LYOSH|nr:putative regulation of endocannabinoid signaling pathway [Lyophyllum shimeji]